MLAGGGLQQVLSGFQANGLSAQTDSWIGTGANKPISGEDVRKVVGDEELAKIAAQLGVSEDEAADAVAQVLPTVVDRVSPEGTLRRKASSSRRSGRSSSSETEPRQLAEAYAAEPLHLGVPPAHAGFRLRSAPGTRRVRR